MPRRSLDVDTVLKDFTGKNIKIQETPGDPADLTVGKMIFSYLRRIDDWKLSDEESYLSMAIGSLVAEGGKVVLSGKQYDILKKIADTASKGNPEEHKNVHPEIRYQMKDLIDAADMVAEEKKK